MSSISRKTLKVIEERGITPQPRWHFFARDCSLWCVLASLLILEIVIVETILYVLLDRYWDVYPFLGMGFWGYLFLSLPYFWMVLLFIFGWVVYQNISRIKTGYRYPFYAVLTGSVVGSMAVGSMLLYGGVIVEVHNIFEKQVPLYSSLVYSKEDIWNNADTGLLGGEIMEEIPEEEVFVLKDLRGRHWRVQREAGEERIRDFPKGSRVRLIGRRQGEDMFYAEDVRPWERFARETE